MPAAGTKRKSEADDRAAESEIRLEFLFLGANIDAVETASQFGIGADRAVNYQCDSEGAALGIEVVSEAISSVSLVPAECRLEKTYRQEDYKKRGGRKHK